MEAEGKPRSWKSRLFYRRVGPWMLNALETILRRFQGHISTVRDVAAGV
jgi:hypothetical protein